ncbi:unnamed protein product [Rangifer tarandus platyrhynchus]|uniref:Uncharacterized protein n=1 Tax=Rangifer tarandus platyrhynchus TaxID=3082113 RepID=A0AC59ZFN5_RANTA
MRGAVWALSWRPSVSSRCLAAPVLAVPGDIGTQRHLLPEIPEIREGPAAAGERGGPRELSRSPRRIPQTGRGYRLSALWREQRGAPGAEDGGCVRVGPLAAPGVGERRGRQAWW